MLRELLSGLIERVIGAYVEDVNSEKLSFALLDGNLALSNLTLKKDTLYRLFKVPLVLDQDKLLEVEFTGLPLHSSLQRVESNRVFLSVCFRSASSWTTIETAQRSDETHGVTISSSFRIFDLDYADDVVCLFKSEFEDSRSLQLDTVFDLHLQSAKPCQGAGSIGRVSVRIPYTHLWSQPWQLLIDDIDIVAHPSAADLKVRLSEDDVPLSESDQGAVSGTSNSATNLGATGANASASQPTTSTTNSNARLDQKSYLMQMEDKWWKAVHSTGVNDATALAAAVAMGSASDTSSWWSYMASFGYGIIRSLQIEIHNVHIRINQYAEGEDEGTSTVGNASFFPLDSPLRSSSSFGTFVVSLDHLTLTTSDVTLEPSSSAVNFLDDNQCKLIAVDGLSITWSDDDMYGSVNHTVEAGWTNKAKLSSTPNLIYVLPPSRLTGRLRRRGVVQNQELASDTPRSDVYMDRKEEAGRQQRDTFFQIEFDTSLGNLLLQFSRGFCKAVVQMLEFTASQYRRVDQYNRRPTISILKGPRRWWQYAAGELRPHLRPYFNRSSVCRNLSALAREAKLNVDYVNEYTAYLLRGLRSTNEELPASLEASATQKNEELMTRERLDEEWPLGRIAALRLVAMRRAAARLNKTLNRIGRRYRSLSSISSTNDEYSHSTIPQSVVISADSSGSVNSDLTEQSPCISVGSPSSTKSWYAWWRYSSWLGLRSIWSSPVVTTTEGLMEAYPDSKVTTSSLQNSSSARIPSEPSTVKDAVLELLDELTLETGNLDNEVVGFNSAASEVIIFRLSCHVDGCTIRLIEDDPAFLPDQMYMHPAILGVSGERMFFSFEVEPSSLSARFAASVESFTVCDERYAARASDSVSSSHQSSRTALFPLIVFPQVRESTADLPAAKGTTTSANSTPAGLFWLVYEVLPADENFDYSLKVRTDPLNVVYQPELIQCATSFLHAVASAASPNLEISARQQYQVIKERTRANIRAMLDETTPTSLDTIHRSEQWSSVDAVDRSTFQQNDRAHSTSQSSRWRLSLDISAPRLLLPDRFHQAESTECSQTEAVTALVCNFGHLNVNNWPVEAKYSSSAVQRVFDGCTEESRVRALYDEDDEEEDLFLTPCGTPVSQSDAEDEPEDITEHKHPEGIRPRNGRKAVHNMYESYVIQLRDLHVLVGRLDELEGFGLWTSPQVAGRSEGGEKVPERELPRKTSALQSPILTIGTSALLGRLCLVDRFSLRLLVSRRIVPFQRLARLQPELATSRFGYPPTFWLTLEQERCVLKLSDSKINNLLKCFNAKTDALTSSDENSSQVRSSSLDQSIPNSSRIALPMTRISSATFDTHHRCTSTSLIQRKRVVATFCMNELIVQLAYKENPVAECHLDGLKTTWIRFTGKGAGYQGRVKIRSFSVADAMNTFGGDYDLIVAAHENVRLNTLGLLDVGSPSTENSVGGQHATSMNLATQSSPNTEELRLPKGHAYPILDFSAENKGAEEEGNLIRLYFDWAPECIDNADRIPALNASGTRNINLHLECLDLVCNPRTLGKISKLLQHLAFLLNILPHIFEQKANSGANESSISSTLPQNNEHLTSYNLQLSLKRFSVLLIRVFDSTTESFDPAKVNDEIFLTVERIATATLMGIKFTSSSDIYRRLISARIGGAQIFDLINTDPKHQCILSTGPCSARLTNPLPTRALSLSPAALSSQDDSFLPKEQSTTNQSASLIVQNGAPSSSRLKLSFFQTVYVHSGKIISEILSWSEDMFQRLSIPLQSALSQNIKSSDQSPTNSACLLAMLSSDVQIHFMEPMILIPSFCTLSSQAMLIRLSSLAISSEISLSSSPLASGRHATSSGLDIHFNNTDLVSLNFSKISELREQQPISSGQVFTFCTNLRNEEKNGVEHVIKSTTFSFSVHFLQKMTDELLPKWISSPALNLSLVDMLSKCEMESDNQFSKWQSDLNEFVGRSVLSLDWLLLEAHFSDELHIQLTKLVCWQIIDTLEHMLPAASSKAGDRHLQTESSSQKPVKPSVQTDESVQTSNFAAYVYIPKLTLDIMAELDIDPVPLAQLQLTDLTAQGLRRLDENATLNGARHVACRVSSAILTELLPPEHENRLSKSNKSPSPSFPRRLLLYSTPEPVTNVGSVHPDRRRSSNSLCRFPSTPNVSRLTECLGFRPSQLKGRLAGRRSLSLSLSAPKNLHESPREQHSAVSPPPAAQLHLLLLDHPNHYLPAKFSQARHFAYLDLNSIVLRACPQAWVLLLDFFNFSENPYHILDMNAHRYAQPRANLDDQNRGSDVPLRPSNIPSEKFSNSVIMCDWKFARIILPSPTRGDSLPKSRVSSSDLAAINASLFKLRVFDQVADLSPHLFADMKWTPCALVTPAYLVEGSLYHPTIDAVSPQGSILYDCRFRCTDSMIAPAADEPLKASLNFLFLRSHVDNFQPSPDGEDAYLWARLAPAYYVHIHQWLITCINSILAFLQDRDLISRMRASTKGMKIETSAPVGTRIRLDLIAEKPRIVIPVHALSTQSIVLDVNKVELSNCFVNLCLSGEAWTSALRDLNTESDGFCLANIDKAVDCMICNKVPVSSPVTLSASSSTEVSKGGRTPCRHFSDSHGLADQCLVDRIHITLSCATFYNAEYCDVPDSAKSKSIDHNSLQFPKYTIRPSQRPDGKRLTLVDPTELHFTVERNLCGSVSHSVADWYIASKFAGLQIHLNTHIYRVIRGLLSHNFGGDGDMEHDSKMDFGVTGIRSLVEHSTISSSQAAITGIPWDVIWLDFELKNSQFIFYSTPSQSDTPSSSSDKVCAFGEVQFIDTNFSFKKQSSQRSVMELLSKDIRFVQTNASGSVNSPVRRDILSPTSEDSVTEGKSRQPADRYRFWVQYVSSTYQILTKLYMFSMSLLFDYDWITRMKDVVFASPMLPDIPVSAIDLIRAARKNIRGTTRSIIARYQRSIDSVSDSPNLFDFRLQVKQSEITFQEKLFDPNSNSLIVQGTSFLSIRKQFELFSTCCTRAHFCLHGLSVCAHRAASLCKLLRFSHRPSVRMDSGRVDLIPYVEQVCPPLPPSQPPQRPQSPMWMPVGQQLSTGFATGSSVCFRSPWADTSSLMQPGFMHMSSLSQQRRPKLSLICSTSTVSGVLSESTFQLYRNILTSVFEQIVMVTRSPGSASKDSEEKREGSKLRILRILQLPEWMLDAVSPHAHFFELTSELSLRFNESESGNFVPLFQIKIDEVNIVWRRAQSPSGVITTSGLQVKYYNRDLVTWEPALESWTSCGLHPNSWENGCCEPLVNMVGHMRTLDLEEVREGMGLESHRCSVEWFRTLANDFQKSTRILFTSTEPLNLNLTVPLLHLIRKMMGSMSRKPSTLSIEDQKGQQTKLMDGTALQTFRPPFQLQNQTGSTVWYKMEFDNESTRAIDNTSLSSGDGSSSWREVKSVNSVVDLPYYSLESPPVSVNCNAGDADIALFGRSPRLLVHVAGWKTAYPIALDRLGTFFRTLERDDTDYELIGSEEADYSVRRGLPLFTRLVAEIVRTDSLRHVVTLRSGLTITNDLPTGHSLSVGFQNLPSIRFSDDVWSSQLDDDDDATRQAVIQRYPLMTIESGQTAAVPLSWAAVSSCGLASLCFCPNVISTLPEQNTAESNSATEACYSTAYDWAAVYAPDSSSVESDGNTSEGWMNPHETAIGHVPELPAEEVAKLMDWTRLKQPGEFMEAALVCRPSTASANIGLVGATLESISPGLVATRPSSPLSLGLKPTHPFQRRTRGMITQPYNMCMAIVHDQFPPDPLWVGLSGSSPSPPNRLHPICLPGHHVTIGPLIRILNLLPCEMDYYFTDTSVTGTIVAGAEACVHELSPAAILGFGVKLEGFPTCEPLTIPPNTYNQKVLLRLQDLLGRPLELQVQVFTRANGARHLTVNAAVWLINDSGLPLVFAQSSSQLSSFSSSSFGSNIAAGQYEEHEQARSMTPLLFSFANKTEGYLLRARVGRGAKAAVETDKDGTKPKTQSRTSVADFHPVWSPGISLDKTGVDVLQLKVLSPSNRPSLVYHVGLEVRPGHGRHAATTIVTFKPRYVVENRAGLRLQLAQRYCLQTHTGHSAIVSLYHGCSQAFHWPRDDLDRLLCVRALLMDQKVTAEETNDWECEQQESKVQTVKTMWSGGFQIDRPSAFTLMLKMLPVDRIQDNLRQSFSGEDVSSVDRLFLRVVVVLRSATFHVVLEDANSLPPPFRLENASYVALSYQQEVSSSSSSSADLQTKKLQRNIDRNSESSTNENIPHPFSDSEEQKMQQPGFRKFDLPLDGHKTSSWLGGSVLSYLGPETTVPYALEEPHCQASLQLSVQGGLSATYNLEQIGLNKTLIYDNFVYMTVLGPLADTCFPGVRSNSLSYELVFDVHPGSHRVVHSAKVPGHRSQLWWLSDTGLIFHEGSSSPHEPGDPLARSRPNRQFVLDVDTKAQLTGRPMTRGEHALVHDAETARHFEVGCLIVAPLSKRRKNYQTWRIDQHGLLVNSALYCVQIYRLPTSYSSDTSNGDIAELIGTPVLAAKPRASATRLVSPSITPAIIFPLWLRPGSGRLRVFLYLDGMTRVLRIEDESDRSSLTADLDEGVVGSRRSAGDAMYRWGSPQLRSMDLSASTLGNATGRDTQSPSNAVALKGDNWREDEQFRILLLFPCGIGISVVSTFAEELIYASLLNVRFSFCRASSLKKMEDDQNTFASDVSADGLNVAGDVLQDSDSQWEGDEDSHNRDEVEESVSLKQWMGPIKKRHTLSDFFFLSIGHIQVDSQFLGASLPVLLFTQDFAETLLSSDHEVHRQSSHSRRRSIPRERTRKQQSESHPPLDNGSDGPSSSPTLTVTFQREVQDRWAVHLFKYFEINASPIIIQAEELLLLKLIQFTQLASTPSLNEIPASDVFDESVHQRSYQSPSATGGTLFWFDRFAINSIPLTLSVQTAKSSLNSSNLSGAKRLLPSLMSFTNAEVRLDSVERNHVLETGSYLFEHLVKHYQLQLRAHAVNIFGSVDFLGNPIGLINDLTSGISGLVELDVGSLIRHVAHGVGDSTAKVAGSVSHLLNAISLDEKHQYERAAILGVRPETSPLLHTRRSELEKASYAGGNPIAKPPKESLDDFELTRVPISLDLARASSSELSRLQTNDSFETTLPAFAPLTAGLRGFMHGLVGGMTSIVTQPYRGIREDQFKGFVYGVGRGLLGTVTKPLGGIFDLVSGAMTTLSEVARSSNHGRPRRRRPRRSGLSKYSLFPLDTYSLDKAITQLQLHRLTVFTSTRYDINTASQTQRSHSSQALEIGEEVRTEGELLHHRPALNGSLQPVSKIIETTVNGSWLSNIFQYPECVFDVLPVQESGVIAILTDRAIWCVSSASLQAWVASKITHDKKTQRRGKSAVSQPTFYLTEHATLMFTLPYQRLDNVSVRTATPLIDAPTSNKNSVYVVFSGDCGVSIQHLRCDHLSWGVVLTSQVREAQFRFVQAAFSLFRPDLSPTSAVSSGESASLTAYYRYGVLLIQGHPLALAYAPVTK